MNPHNPYEILGNFYLEIYFLFYKFFFSDESL